MIDVKAGKEIVHLKIEGANIEIMTELQSITLLIFEDILEGEPDHVKEMVVNMYVDVLKEGLKEILLNK